MKWLIILFLLFSSSIFAFTEYRCIFLSFEPSSINQAMGETVGVVNIWHNNPLTFYANPAIAAFHEGISYGYKNDAWFGEVIDDIFYNVAFVSLGYKGMSLTFPGLNRNSKWGINLDCGFEDRFDEYGNYLGKFQSYEDATVWGIALNPIEVYRNFGNADTIFKYFNFSIGINRIGILSNLPYIGAIPPELSGKGKGEATSYNLGIVTGLNYNYEEYFIFETVLGYTRFNIFDDKLIYVGDFEDDSIYSHNNLGYAFSVALPTESYLSNFKPSLLFFNHLLTARFLSATIRYPNSEIKINGLGGEIALMDTFFYRIGRYEDKFGCIVGNSQGFGIKLNYRNLCSFSFNFAEFPGGGLVNKQKSTDFGLNLDILGIIDVLHNQH